MAKIREPLPRLNLNPPLSQAGVAFGPGQSTFSPILPTAIHVGPGQAFQPHWGNHPLQTPMQPFFSAPPPPPGHPGRHAGHASISNFTNAGIHPVNGFPLSPLNGPFPRPLTMGLSGQHPMALPFLGPHRQRRQMSIGGPPKAILGGPARRLSPMPVVLQNPTPPPPQLQKIKKVNINIPQETISGEDGQPFMRPDWARNVLDGFRFQDLDIPEPKLITAESYPSDEDRHHIPNVLEVFLPGKRAWNFLRHADIEEKLEKLGVEKGSGSSVPNIFAPHARAASISSPADPQVLAYKLNKLQQSQDPPSSNNSISASPHLPFGLLSSSPHGPSRFGTNRHGQTMSLAVSPQYFLDPNTNAFDPFGPNMDQVVSPILPAGPSILQDGFLSPRGSLPLTVSLVPPERSRPTSRPDFIRGFGLDIPEEEEEEGEEEEIEAPAPKVEESLPAKQLALTHLDRVGPQERAVDDINVDYDQASSHSLHTTSQSRTHSRHVSRLSAALSTRSAGALEEDEFVGEEDVVPPVNLGHPLRLEAEEDLDGVGEWTGSEDMGEISDAEESIGECSNPSDEERFRQERMDRRARRKTVQIDRPRRIPNFPRPPENTMVVPLHRDDDIISNPSEEGHERLDAGEYLGVDYYAPGSTPNSRSSLALPPPHSRTHSAQHTAHDPAHAHSRESSMQIVPGQPSHGTLNPHAKPFVFGVPREPWTRTSFSSDTPSKEPFILSHSRVSSVGKPLNIAAPEFKPGAFNFHPPPGLPTMPAAPVFNARPLPEVSPSIAGSPFRVQGREKRPRLGSNNSFEESDNMMSFRFPVNLDSPASIQHTPGSQGHKHKLNPSAEPFTFSGFSAVARLPYVSNSADKENIPPSPLSREANDEAEPETPENEITEKDEIDNYEVEKEFDISLLNKVKRAPVPLDFTHPVSTNTVPAGLFKALINNGEERTRRTVRSRMGSHDLDHARIPSMDDLNVTSIAHSLSRSRSRLVTDPGLRQASPKDDVFGHPTHFRRRSSFTDIVRPIRPLSGSDDGSHSGGSALSLTGRLEMQQTERRIENMLDERVAALRQDLRKENEDSHLVTQTMISEVQSLFRSQLREAAVRSLEDSRMDARAEMNSVQLFKDIVEGSNKVIVKSIGDELQALQQQVWRLCNNTESAVDVKPLIEAISEFSARHDAVAHVTPARERDAIVDKLTTSLTPLVQSLRQEPINYELLTSQLTQAVKPHISQLIDLASDKRETAGLIVDRIIPMLPQSNIDLTPITSQLTTEIRRVIAPIDAFEIKEQVADLVVERLDSRLAVRDKAFNPDGIATRVIDSVSSSLTLLKETFTSLDQLAKVKESLSDFHKQLESGHTGIVELVSTLPSKLGEEFQELKSTQHLILSKLEQATVAVQELEPDQNVLLVKTAVEDIVTGQKLLGAQADELHSLQKTIFEKLDALPEIIQDSATSGHGDHADLLSSLETARKEADELRKSNAEHQSLLAKSRAAHGQIRVEKDMLDEKVQVISGERDRLRVQVKELETSTSEASARVTSSEIKNRELEDALANALSRLQSSDVTAQTNQTLIETLDKANREITTEKQALKSKVNTLELEATIATRDKESMAQAFASLQQQYDQLASQQSHWDDLRRASEKIELLSNLIGQADNEELKELRRYRDRTRTLEAEHAALQKRFKEQEGKISNSERTAFTARQSLAQAQQRSSEWERRAKDFEAQLEMTRTKLEQAEQSRSQTESDYSLVKMQLEEREANDRLVKDQQVEQITSLETKVVRLQTELEKARSSKPVTTPYRALTNGSHAPPRPDSRASTIYDERTMASRRPSMTSTIRGDTPPKPSVWDSMHAPTTQASPTEAVNSPPSIYTPRSRYPRSGTPFKGHQSYHTRSVTSPAPSVASVALTQDDDGWWS